jgi:hypothetical protein
MTSCIWLRMSFSQIFLKGFYESERAEVGGVWRVGGDL